MSWDGVERRFRSREDDILDLDMTWQESVRGLHARITHIEEHMGELVTIMQQAKGALRALSLIGGVLVAVISGWDTVKGWIK